MATVLLIHAAATLYMAGLIWFVQLVHYPLLAHVGRQGYADYQKQHEKRTTLAVAPAMLIEMAAALWLVVDSQAGVQTPLAWAGLVMLVLIWLSTALLQVPCHKRLSKGFDADAHRRLVTSNWLRTVLWSGRAAIALALLA